MDVDVIDGFAIYAWDDNECKAGSGRAKKGAKSKERARIPPTKQNWLSIASIESRDRESDALQVVGVFEVCKMSTQMRRSIAPDCTTSPSGAYCRVSLQASSTKSELTCVWEPQESFVGLDDMGNPVINEQLLKFYCGKEKEIYREVLESKRCITAARQRQMYENKMLVLRNLFPSKLLAETLEEAIQTSRSFYHLGTQQELHRPVKRAKTMTNSDYLPPAVDSQLPATSSNCHSPYAPYYNSLSSGGPLLTCGPDPRYQQRCNLDYGYHHRCGMPTNCNTSASVIPNVQSSTCNSAFQHVVSHNINSFRPHCPRGDLSGAHIGTRTTPLEHQCCSSLCSPHMPFVSQADNVPRYGCQTGLLLRKPSLPVSRSIQSLPVSHSIQLLPVAPVSRSIQSLPVSHSTQSLPVAPVSRSIQSLPVSHSIQSLPVSHSIQPLPVSHSTQSLPVAPVSRSIQSLPVSHSIQSLPISHSTQSLPVSHSIQSLPGSHSIQSLPVSHSIQSPPVSHSIQSLPVSHSIQLLPVSHSTQSFPASKGPSSQPASFKKGSRYMKELLSSLSRSDLAS